MFERTKTFWRRLIGEPGQGTTAMLEPGADERRVWIRYPADLETAYKPAAAADNLRLSARVRNISLGGVNLMTNRAFQPGELLSIELPGDTEDSRCNALACVVHCAEELPGEWSLGCTFSRELTEDDLAAFGARRERPTASDQRQWKRFPGNVIATYQLVALDDLQQYPAQVLDISASGVGLLVDREIDNGALLSIELRNAAATTERTMLACVVHLHRHSAHEWALGCNFIRSLSEDDLQALV
jgi:c-di-GMP-binding flagellar brake protein YcgR